VKSHLPGIYPGCLPRTVCTSRTACLTSAFSS